MANANMNKNIHFQGPDSSMLILLVSVLIGALYSLLLSQANLTENLTHSFGIGLILGGCNSVIRKSLSFPPIWINYTLLKGNQAIGAGFFLILLGIIIFLSVNK